MSLANYYPQCIVSLDCQSLPQAKKIIAALGDRIDIYKIHSLYDKHPSILPYLLSRNKRVFLDYKIHDTPHATSLRIENLFAKSIDFLTVHFEALNSVTNLPDVLEKHPGIVAVTSLTSDMVYDPRNKLEVSLQEIAWGQIRLRMARYSRQPKYCTCPGMFLERFKAEYPEVQTITPGVKYPTRSTPGQHATHTAGELLAMGGDYLILGSGIYDATDPVEALDGILNLST